MFGGEGAGDGGGFGPGMDGKSELIVVDGEDLLGLEIQDNFFEIFGRRVDIFPIGIVLTVFQESKVNRAKPLVYLSKNACRSRRHLRYRPCVRRLRP